MYRRGDHRYPVPLRRHMNFDFEDLRKWWTSDGCTKSLSVSLRLWLAKTAVPRERGCIIRKRLRLKKETIP